MRIASLLRVVLSVLLLALGTACAPNRPAPLPAVATEEADIVMPLPAVLQAPQQWSGRTITLVAPIRPESDDRVLGSADPTAAGANNAIWLAQPLPEDVRRTLKDGMGLLKLHGLLSPPGAYGTEQRFPYQFTADRAVALVPERTTIANLALNPGALDQIVLRLRGTLLVRPDAALLVDEVGEGGVPLTSAKQLKVPRSAIDQRVLEELQVTGDVRLGNVEIVGWWQNGALTPLTIVAGEPDLLPDDLVDPSATTEP